MKFGIKTNLKKESLDNVKKLSKIYDFAEIYFRQDNVETSKLASIKTRWMMHVPHAPETNFIKKVRNGVEVAKKSILYGTDLKIERAIVHAGSMIGKKFDIKQMIENLKELNEFCNNYGVRMVIENVPLRIQEEPGFAFGSKPEEIKKILTNVKCGFVLDFSHVYHSCFSHKEDPKKMLKDFMKLEPEMFHLCDTKINQGYDIHLPLGKGMLDIQYLLSFIKDEDVTLELPPPIFDVYIDAINYLKKF
jgi:sugar phosphate isomerase/epimerase